MLHFACISINTLSAMFLFSSFHFSLVRYVLVWSGLFEFV